MEAAWPPGGLWALALLPPTLLLAALCARCRRPRGPTLESSDYKVPPCVPPTGFVVIGPTRCEAPHGCPTACPDPRRGPAHGPAQPLPHPQPPLWGAPTEGPQTLTSPHPPPSRRVSVAPPEPDPPEGDDDYSNEPYATGYVEVLPEEAVAEGTPPGGDSGSSVTVAEEYENVPDGVRRSLGDSLEYINVAPPESAPPSESEDGPDYENL